ncbi:MAG TPA: hypothetical protein VMW13_03230, partial [Dehalococcoidales bacterium]|nr:hypothetical protein [Dehalococcoidales bacterium]
MPATGIVTVQFPIGTTVPITAAWVAGDITLQATAGFGTAIPVQNWDPTQIATTAGSTLAGPIVAMTVTTGAAPAFPNGIGEGATVRIKFNNLVVTNPSAIASYTLTVKTNQTGDTTAVASQAYVLTAPVVPALPGIVEVYNPTGILMASNTGAGAIQTSLNAAGAGFTVKIGPGTYNESPNTPAGFTGMTIISSSSAANTLVTGNWAVTQASTTISGLTLANAVAGVANPTVNVTGDKSVITGCVFTKAGSLYTAVAEAAGLLAFNVAAPTAYASVTNSTFDTTLDNVLAGGAVQDSALIINQAGVSVSDCTFAVDATLAGANDTAITINGGSALLPVALTG